MKYLLFGFNFIFWLAGTAVLAIGLWLRFDGQTKSVFDAENSSNSFYTGVYILIGAGALMMVVGFLGCCGAIQESQCMLALFFAFLLVIFAIEIAAGIWGFANRDKIISELKTFYSETYTDYIASRKESLKETLKAVQYALNCCGLTGVLEAGLTDTCPPQDSVIGSLTIKGCPRAIEDVFNSKLKIIGIVGIVIGVIMIFGMVFSMVLCCAIRNNREMV